MWVRLLVIVCVWGQNATVTVEEEELHSKGKHDNDNELYKPCAWVKLQRVTNSEWGLKARAKKRSYTSNV